MISNAMETVIFGTPTDQDPILTYDPDSAKFFWVFYAGMGSSDYHSVNDHDAGYAQACVDFGQLKITKEKIRIPNVYEGFKVVNP